MIHSTCESLLVLVLPNFGNTPRNKLRPVTARLLGFLIWLGSIVANAPDCLSGYRGFESHPSRHVCVRKQMSPHTVSIKREMCSFGHLTDHLQCWCSTVSISACQADGTSSNLVHCSIFAVSQNCMITALRSEQATAVSMKPLCFVCKQTAETE